ncbi:MAG: glutathione S-transferase N-terminal domain-containing protein [Pseudomonadota bacterium]
MIELYTWTTPNGRKISVALEEMGLDYDVKPTDIGQDQQFSPEFLAISPNNKIPAIVDTDNGVSVFESGAILTYLGEKSGKFLPAIGAPERAKVLEWLAWQVGGFGPMLGQLNHFARYREDKIPEAIERFATESARLYKVLDTQLGKTEFVGGDYSIADIAIYPWSLPALVAVEQMSGSTFSNVARWHETVGARPAVQKGMNVPPSSDG